MSWYQKLIVCTCLLIGGSISSTYAMQTVPELDHVWLWTGSGPYEDIINSIQYNPYNNRIEMAGYTDGDLTFDGISTNAVSNPGYKPLLISINTNGSGSEGNYRTEDFSSSEIKSIAISPSSYRYGVGYGDRGSVGYKGPIRAFDNSWNTLWSGGSTYNQLQDIQIQGNTIAVAGWVDGGQGNTGNINGINYTISGGSTNAIFAGLESSNGSGLRLYTIENLSDSRVVQKGNNVFYRGANIYGTSSTIVKKDGNIVSTINTLTNNYYNTVIYKIDSNGNMTGNPLIITGNNNVKVLDIQTRGDKIVAVGNFQGTISINGNSFISNGGNDHWLAIINTVPDRSIEQFYTWGSAGNEGGSYGWPKIAVNTGDDNIGVLRNQGGNGQNRYRLSGSTFSSGTFNYNPTAINKNMFGIWSPASGMITVLPIDILPAWDVSDIVYTDGYRYLALPFAGNATIGGYTMSSVGYSDLALRKIGDRTPPGTGYFSGLISPLLSPGLTGILSDPSTLTDTITLLINGISYTGTNNGNNTWSLASGILTGLTEGTYNVDITVKDKKLNTTVSHFSGSLIIDTVPIVSYGFIQGGYVGDLLPLSITVDQTGSISFSGACQGISVSPNTAVSGALSSYRVNGLAAGTYSNCMVIVMDPRGQSGYYAIPAFTVSNRPSGGGGGGGSRGPDEDRRKSFCSDRNKDGKVDQLDDGSKSYYDNTCEPETVTPLSTPNPSPSVDNMVARNCPYSDGKFVNYKDTMRDIKNKSYKDGVIKMLDRCLIHGVKGKGTSFGGEKNLNYGELYKIAYRLSQEELTLKSDGANWADAYYRMGNVMKFWKGVGKKDVNASVTIKDLIAIINNINDYDSSIFEQDSYEDVMDSLKKIRGSSTITRGKLALILDDLLD